MVRLERVGIVSFQQARQQCVRFDVDGDKATQCCVILRLVIRHLQPEALDHFVMLSVERDEGERVLHGGCRDKGIEYVKAVRFRIAFQQLVGSRSNALAPRPGTTIKR